MTRRRRVLLVLAGVLAAFVGWEVLTTFVAYTDDAFVRSDLIGLAPQVTGRVVALHVVDNQTVRAGDPILDIDPVPFQLAVDRFRAAVREADAQLNADVQTIASAHDAIDSAVATRLLAEDTQRRMAALDRTGDAPRAQLDDANAALRNAEAAVDEARAALARDEAISAMHEAARAKAQAELGQAEWNLGRTNMVSPADGTVTNLSLRVGDTARTDVPIIGIVDAHAWRVIANYKQSYLRGFKEGSTAWVWLDSQPWHFHRARVAGIARGISRQQDEVKLLPYVAPTTDWIRLQRRFPVTLTLVDPPPSIALYMGADARVVIFP
jgi:multidrug efflux system membrane fusion protein